jgi:hypothetical protein
MDRPDDVPAPVTTTLLPLTAGKATILVMSTRHIILLRSFDTQIETDRSEEFSKDSILIRGTIRAVFSSPITRRLSGSPTPPQPTRPPHRWE